MKLAIMQPYMLPYIGYWQLMNYVDKFVIYDDVNFIKQGWINRNRVLLNGKEHLISIPIQKISSNKLINEIKVLDNPNYNKKFIKMIRSCYQKAPFFGRIFPMIEEIVYCEETNLAKYLEFSLVKINEYLEIDTQLIVSSTINKDNDLKGQDKVIEICKIFDAKEYINSIGGYSLYSFEEFNDNDINLRFLETHATQYKQFNNVFVPNLSIIDVMMFNELPEIKLMLENFKLVKF